jgi:cob(I)alamin adenosyltransferase
VARIYTKAGDAGRTGYLGKGRLAKDHPRIAALGSLDELNAAIGMVLADRDLLSSVASRLRRIQNTLFDAGASVASADPERGKLLLDAETGWLEELIDRIELELDPLERFILPGGSRAGAGLHWARTVSRRAERDLVHAFGRDVKRTYLLRYLNRLSDALFVLARQANRLDGVAETPWESAEPPRKSASKSTGMASRKSVRSESGESVRTAKQQSKKVTSRKKAKERSVDTPRRGSKKD